MTSGIKFTAVLAIILALIANPALAQDSESNLSDLFEPQPGTAKWLADGQVQLSYSYTAPNACWSLGTVQVAATIDTVLVVLLTPEITQGVCAMRLTALDYQPVLEADVRIETIFVQVMHPMGQRIETSEILIE